MSKFNISFVSKFPVSVVLSAVLVIGSLSLFFSKGLNYGVDFRGGAEIQVAFEKETQLEELRSSLDANKFDSSSVQRIGSESQNEFLVKL